MATWLSSVTRALWPAQCVGCRTTGAWWCTACHSTVRRTANDRCPSCERASTQGRYCPGCRVRVELHGIIAGASFDGPLTAAVRALKYRHATAAATALADYPAAAWKASRLESGVLVPIPLHPAKLRSRGHNQAELLAKAIARRTGLPLERSLRRLRNTPSQTGLSKFERARNVGDAFAWCGPWPEGARIYLVDDVATTGATLNAAARTLKHAGAGEVWGLVVARRVFAASSSFRSAGTGSGAYRSSKTSGRSVPAHR